MSSTYISGSYDSSKIMRILYLVKKNYEWWFISLGSKLKYIFNLCIFIRSCLGYNTLMMSCLGHRIKSLFFNKVNSSTCSFYFIKYFLNSRISQTILNIQFINSTTGLYSLEYTVSSFKSVIYNSFFFFYIRCLTRRFRV